MFGSITLVLEIQLVKYLEVETTKGEEVGCVSLLNAYKQLR